MTDTEKLALALAAIEAAKEVIGDLVGVCAAKDVGLAVNEQMYDDIDKGQAKFAELVTKLEQSK